MQNSIDMQKRIQINEEELKQLIARAYNTEGIPFTEEDENHLDQSIKQILQDQEIINRLIEWKDYLIKDYFTVLFNRNDSNEYSRIELNAKWDLFKIFCQKLDYQTNNDLEMKYENYNRFERADSLP